jgi:hypothetical protein
VSFLSPEVVANVSAIEVAFGGGHKYLPAMADIPEGIESTPFYRLACDIFYEGKPSDKTPALVLKREYESVADKIPGLTRSILGSFQPKHEHKMAGMALLLSEMFEEAEVPETSPQSNQDKQGGIK